MATIEHDWIERFSKALLPRHARLLLRHRRQRRFFQRHVRSTDVFLVGHPKSGNTWLAYMLAVLRMSECPSHVTLANLGQYVPGIFGKDVRIADFPAIENPRIFREEYPTHDDLYPKTLYLIRDPRAVIVSLFHMYRIECNHLAMPMAEFVNDYLTGSGCFREWNRGLIRWDRQAMVWIRRATQDPGVLIVRYEDLVENRRGVLEQVARFAAIPYLEKNLAVAVERGSFAAMQQCEDEYGSEAYPEEMAARGRFIRRGEIDSWREEMSPSLVRQIEHELGPAMKTAGYA